VSDVLALFETAYFRAGLRLGLVGLGMGWALRLIIGRFRPPLPIAGIFIAVITTAGLYLTGEPLGPTIPALLAILVAVLVTRLLNAPRWTQPLATIPGAVWLAFGAPVGGVTWVRVLWAVLIVAGGYAITDFETRHDRMGLGVIFFALATVGVFAAVPDTEEALIVMAASLPVTLLAWPKVAASMGAEGSYLAVAMLLWVTIAGGEGRPPSIIGSAACLGLLLLEPVLYALRPAVAVLWSGLRRNWFGAMVATLPQLVVVIICSRVAARFNNELPTILVVAAVFGLTAWAAIYFASRRPQPTEDAFTPLTVD
jgi:hypothetical protein